MRTSVIIPTYNGAHKILNALHALEKQTVLPDEVIVVVDGSTDNTIFLLRNTNLRLPSWRFIEQKNSGRACVRNKGAQEAEGDLLIFLDDDMMAESALIETHIRHQMTYQGSILTGAQIDPFDENKSDFHQFKAYLSRKWSEGLSRFEHTPMPLDKIYVTAANLSLSKALFIKLGGFDQRLTDGEDFDLAMRANKENISIYYNPSAYAWHMENNSCALFIKRNRCYYNAGIYLLAINPVLYTPLFGHRTKARKTIKEKVFKLFCSSFWIRTIDQDKWVWLPKSIRYKLYDYVSTANSHIYPELVKL